MERDKDNISTSHIMNSRKIGSSTFGRVDQNTEDLIIGASLSEPLLDESAGAFLWYIYIYIFVSIMGSPFGPA